MPRRPHPDLDRGDERTERVGSAPLPRTSLKGLLSPACGMILNSLRAIWPSDAIPAKRDKAPSGIDAVWHQPSA